MTVLFDTEPEHKKFYIVHYTDPATKENKFYFADNFELACDRAESIVREFGEKFSFKIHIFEEVLTYTKHEKTKR